MIAKISESIPADFEKYVKDLKSGYYYGADLEIYMNHSTGVGIKYNRFRSSNYLDNVVVTTPGGNITGRMEDNIKTDYLGLSLALRYINPAGNAIIQSSCSLGGLFYKNDSQIATGQIDIKGSNLGFAISFGLDFKLARSIFFGVETTGVLGNLHKIYVNGERIELDEENRENISWIGISMGIRFNL